jgi:hypothetical protein
VTLWNWKEFFQSLGSRPDGRRSYRKRSLPEMTQRALAVESLADRGRANRRNITPFNVENVMDCYVKRIGQMSVPARLRATP